MTICFFGRYNPEYSRNKVLIKGLEMNDVEVVECHSNKKGIKKYFDLIKKHRKIKNDYDVLFVAFPGWHAMILAKFLTKKPIIFDAFVSVYDSTVFDRKNTSRYSPKAWYFWLLDWLSCKLADKVLLDTNEHIKYFVEEFNLPKEKFERIFVGSFAENFAFNIKKQSEKFHLIFYGFLIPLQGLDSILEAAKILEEKQNIIFDIIGSKIKRAYGGKGYKNVNFIDDLKYEDLLQKIKNSDVCLGIFGNTDKAQRVISNKVYDCVALNKPVITADTLAIRELFDENDLLLVPTADPKALVEAILELKNNSEKMEILAKNGYDKFIQRANIDILSKQVKEIAEKLR